MRLSTKPKCPDVLTREIVVVDVDVVITNTTNEWVLVLPPSPWKIDHSTPRRQEGYALVY